jgi:hypothetical protein
MKMIQFLLGVIAAMFLIYIIIQIGHTFGWW